MPEKRTTITSESTNNNNNAQKRKRVKRIKNLIIISFIILLILPTLLCIILGIRLGRLQRQVDEILSNKTEYYEHSKQNTNNGQYAYASETTDETQSYHSSDNYIIDNGESSNESLDSNDFINNSNITNINDVTYKGDINNEVINNKEVIDNKEIIDNSDVIDNNGVINNSDITKNNEIISNNNDSDEINNNNEFDVSGEQNVYKPNGTYKSSNDSNDSSMDVNNNVIDSFKQTDEKHDKENQDNENQADGHRGDVIETNEDNSYSEGIYNEKNVYLTFDDGPSKITDEILDILEQYNTKATFFVVGNTDNEAIERYKRIVNEGHTLGMHSYSHDYNEIYNSVEDFDKDFTKLWKLLYDTTGHIPSLYRFPGGSLNKVSKVKTEDLIRYLNEKGMIYYDWNVVNGDATGIDYTEEQMIDNVLNGVASKRTSIVLMHDGMGKNKTVAMLPELLEALISGGAKVLPMDDTVPLIQQIKAKSVK